MQTPQSQPPDSQRQPDFPPQHWVLQPHHSIEGPSQTSRSLLQQVVALFPTIFRFRYFCPPPHFFEHEDLSLICPGAFFSAAGRNLASIKIH